MKSGSFEKVIADFEAQNPDIKVKVISNPSSEQINWLMVAAASNTLSDVVAVEPALLDSWIKQNVVDSLDDLILRDNYDVSQIASIPKVDNKTWIFPVSTFIYPLYYNTELFRAAGITKPPATYTEFIEACRKLTNRGKNQYGWTFPLTLSPPFGVQNVVLSWMWANQKQVFPNGRPNLDTADMRAVLNLLNTLYQEGIITPGSLTKNEPEEMEEFANGNAAMMIGSIAHIYPLRERNPQLQYDLAPMPVADNYTGRAGSTYAAWGVGISKNAKNRDAAWKLIKYLMSPEVNAYIAANANAFPGNKNAKPDFSASDSHFARAFEIYQQTDLRNELIGAPNVMNLVTVYGQEIHGLLEKKQSLDQTIRNTQAAWLKEYQ
ncbi:MAG: sugar ABC transporter substrate-binding protein [Treponema sp.]|nr:sugar ABC transporter substrate-binding protein [Treponema sp.]